MTEKARNKTDIDFYTDAANYWSEIPATLNGMLGGFGFISETDIRASKLLLKQLFNSEKPPGRQNALDCGAGIGRITKFLLSDHFECVDLVEQNGAFLEQAKQYLGPKLSKIGHFFPVGLQNFEPEAGRYDVIWIQWVLGHLTDSDLVKFLKLCQKGLKPGGVIVIKENTASSEDVDVDEKDSSVTRPFALLKSLFKSAGLDCIKLMKQNDFPKGLYSVYMFALRPLTCTEQ